MTETDKPVQALVHITMRIPAETLEYFQHYENPRTAMREVLDEYVEARNRRDQD